MSNVYSGTFDNDNWYQTRLNGEVFDPAPSQAVWNKSPDGFAWGYGGSGPAQLAIAILLEETGDKEFVLDHFMEFKREVVAGLPCDPGDEWALTSEQVQEWISTQEVASGEG